MSTLEKIMGDDKMIFTYLIQYEGGDNFGSIEFCAQTKNEARKLFNDWCIIDNKMNVPVVPKSIEIVYNEEDALEYGDNYYRR
ncbi:MAG: hypothetical protein PUC12_16890 [Clostridiales bacterium]|nr:hypothetical protein [Clostridiales bacterium]